MQFQLIKTSSLFRMSPKCSIITFVGIFFVERKTGGCFQFKSYKWHNHEDQGEYEVQVLLQPKLILVFVLVLGSNTSSLMSSSCSLQQQAKVVCLLGVLLLQITLPLLLIFSSILWRRSQNTIDTILNQRHANQWQGILPLSRLLHISISLSAVTGHLATSEFRHQPTRHQDFYSLY